MNKRASIYEAKAKLTSLVREVMETGEAFTVTKHGKPAVDVVPHQEKKTVLKPHPDLKGAEFVGDPCAPVSGKDWPEHHNDPFDRLVVATAATHGLTILSKDRRFQAYEVVATVWD